MTINAPLDNVEAALATLEALLPDDAAKALVETKEEDSILLHLGLGTWVRNVLGLWNSS
jgi:hypothetical protein